jgi:beta-lactamase regulating signal transducer with metallopeptidase domain
MVLAAFFAAHAARALLRAKRALKAEGEPLAATLGLLRPRVFISPRLAASLDSNALEAAREHERAHARHRDGLRIWLAQLATDLQWPWPAAQARLRSWLHALELARDEEARRRGTNGSDLAAAILGAVRIAQAAGSTPPAALLGAQDMLSDRLSRLLEPVCPEEGQRATRWYHVPILLGVLTLVAAVGARCGEPLVRWLLGTWN